MAQTQEFDGQSKFMQGCPKDLRGCVLVEAVKSRSGAEVEREAFSDATGPPLPLLQISLRAPDSSVVGHVVVRCKQLHFSSDLNNDRSNCNSGIEDALARVNDKDHVVDGNAALSDVG